MSGTSLPIPRSSITKPVYDGLGRLVSTAYPDGTSTSNWFERLHLAGTRDRLGHWTRYAYDPYGRMTSVTNALGKVTAYSYCDCGPIESVTDALANTTSFYYDALGRLALTVHPDASWTSNRYDLLGRVVSAHESSGYAQTNWHNNQGLVCAVSNALGLVTWREFDALDRPWKTRDANSLTVTNSFDALGRILSSVRNETGPADVFTYAAAGLVSHSNAFSITWFTNDAAGRRIAERNSNGEVTRFAYSPAGDLLVLTDANSHSTAWAYDRYGQVTNKTDTLGAVLFAYRYDANGRLTNRWTPAKLDTGYGYDALGNLTNVDYTASPDIRLAYDALRSTLPSLMSAQWCEALAIFSEQPLWPLLRWGR